MIPARYTLFGADASFFTRKLEAVLRYQRLPFDKVAKDFTRSSVFEERAGTRMIPILRTPENWMLWDSTPIARLLDARYPERRILPSSPAQRIACLLFEDWYDEWFTRPAHYTRWAFPENSERMIRRSIATTMFGRDLESLESAERANVDSIAAEAAPAMTAFMRDGVAPRVAATLETGRDIDEWFEAFWGDLATHLESHRYLLGDRPCVADFAIIGSSIAHFSSDPGPRRLLERVAPTVLEYSARGWNAVAGDEAWLPNDQVPPTWAPFFAEMEGRYLRYLRANREAIGAQRSTVSIDLGYGNVEIIAVPYREQARLDVGDEIRRLDEAGQARVREVIPSAILEAYLLPPLGDVEPADPTGLFPPRSPS